jgi:hypothetical protein
LRFLKSGTNAYYASGCLIKILTKDVVWQELISNNYLHPKSLSQVKVKTSDSPFWKGLMKLKDEFFERGSFTLRNRESTHFLEDIWLGNKPFAKQ